MRAWEPFVSPGYGVWGGLRDGLWKTRRIGSPCHPAAGAGPHVAGTASGEDPPSSAHRWWSASPWARASAAGVCGRSIGTASLRGQNTGCRATRLIIRIDKFEIFLFITGLG